MLRESLESFAAANNISSLVFRKKVWPQTKPAGKSAAAVASRAPIKPRTRSNSMGNLNDKRKKADVVGAAGAAAAAVGTQRAKVVVDATGTVRLTALAPAASRRRAIPDFVRGGSAKPLPVRPSPGRRRNSSENVRGAAGVGAAVLPYGFFEGVPWDLFCLDVEELSRQLSLQHQRLFRAINPMELLNQNWNKESKQLKVRESIVGARFCLKSQGSECVSAD